VYKCSLLFKKDNSKLLAHSASLLQEKAALDADMKISLPSSLLAWFKFLLICQISPPAAENKAIAIAALSLLSLQRISVLCNFSRIHSEKVYQSHRRNAKDMNTAKKKSIHAANMGW
jgi:hypothetical protein